ncbi:MAG TPA: hypothetical protein VL547_22470 [Dinghuibacter sp.]|uniref:hypothetical protein n=1 Tax=Dinghuibacter sp. TaxID=2024697 RepID=UPI002C5B166B|nr:hypothetical protein [Dinghuibacter sp.]HTJ14827.1 hypothetical protein [Dinghuibacter sp.]
MKQIINTTGLLLLMSLSSFAGSLKDTTAVRVADAPDALFAAEFAQVAANLKFEVVNADAQMTLNYAAAYTDHKSISRADALTDLQMSAAVLGNKLDKTSVAAAKDADQQMNAAHRKAVALEAPDFQGATLTKLLIASDNAIHQQFARQYGMEVASSK